MGDFVLEALRLRAPDRMAAWFPRHRFRLYAMLTTAGCERIRDPSYAHDGNKRGSFVLLQQTLSGRGRLRFEGRDYLVGAGQTMLLRFPHDNRYWLAEGDEWEFFWIALNGREVNRVWREAMINGPLVRLPEAVVLRLAAICHAALAAGPQTPGCASAMAYEVAMLLADALVLRGEPPAEPPRGGIERALSLCETDAVGDRRVDVGRLAEAAGLSRSQFSRRFAQETGLPPGRTIANRRMEEAVRLLRTTDLAVGEVARACGFADPNHFAKAFRGRLGCSPREFRRGRM